MSTIRRGLICATLSKAVTSIDSKYRENIQKQFEFIKQTILADNSLTNDEKTEAIRLCNKNCDREKIRRNEGTRRICENCNKKCLATSYCEYCVRNHLKGKFSSWSSGNNDIDNLIQKCQSETLNPNMITEWIPYNNLQKIEYLTKGGFAKIYRATWINGGYYEWDSENQQLQRFVNQVVILKELENIENASQNWFEEAKSHLTISNKYTLIVQCYGLTQNPSNGNYMLVMDRMNINLREYLQQNNNQLIWKERIEIMHKIINAIYYIHKENSIHRDLHSGNILYSQFSDNWCISDLGFCGPVDRLSTSIYGNLPYIAPEIINGKEYTFKSDIYSIGMLMWEVSVGLPPFMNHEHNYDLALNIINGMRPKIISEIPLKYKNLMEKCWDADPLKRPDIRTLSKKIKEIKSYYQNNPNELSQLKIKINEETSYHTSSSEIFSSKIHKFENLPEPKNATEEQQEAFHSKLYDFNIPTNIDDFGRSSNKNNKRNSIVIEAGSTRLTGVFKKLRVNSKSVNIQNKYYENTIRQPQTCDIDDDDDYNNPNLHSEEQEELEIPNDGF